jgi:acyl carrier protein
MLNQVVMSFLSQAAREARTEMPGSHESLFETGVLDSFSLVEFVALLERECHITVRDADLRPENFDTIAKVEAYVRRTAEA